MQPTANKAVAVLAQLETALETLRRATGLQARIVRRELRAREMQGDALIEIKLLGRTHRFAVEARTIVDRPEALGRIKNQLDHFEIPGLVFAPYITDRIARKCRELDLPFLDTVGNAYLRGPGLYVFLTGQRPRGALPAAPPRALDTTTALRMIFGLLCQPELLNAPYRDIRDATRIALGAVGPVFRDLRRRGYIAGRRGMLRLVEPVRLFEEWVTNYPLKLRPKLGVQVFQCADPNWWRTVPVDELGGAWGGEVAADVLTGYLKPQTFTLYIAAERRRHAVPRLVKKYRLAANPDGNVQILEKFWKFPPDEQMRNLVPPILTYADLMATLDPRNVEAAKLVRENYIDRVLNTL